MLMTKLFEFQNRRRLGHLLFQEVDNLFALARKKQKQALHDRPVLGGGRLVDARGGATVNMMIQTLAVLVSATGASSHAGSDGKNGPHHLHGSSQRAGVGVGAKVARTVPGGPAGDDRLGVLFPHGDLEVRKAFVVPEPDVVWRSLFLDESHFQKKRFHLTVGDNGFDLANSRDKSGLLGMIGAAAPEVGSHPLIQALGLTDIENLAGAVLHDVDPSSPGQMGKAFG